MPDRGTYTYECSNRIDNSARTFEEVLKNPLPQAECIDILTAYFYFSGFSKDTDDFACDSSSKTADDNVKHQNEDVQ
jgi:regulator of sirC expression with transglutaminase-like and TPR domain